MANPSGRVFLCYRRGDSRHIAGRLADRLTQLGRVQVFMDVDSMHPGDDFPEAIAKAVSSCSILLAVIGPNWLTVCDTYGRRRLDNPDDWIRQEIRAALIRDIRVIPVLVDEAQMPTVVDLPADLAGLARRNAVRVDHETFATDIRRLLDAVEHELRPPQVTRATARHQAEAGPRPTIKPAHVTTTSSTAYSSPSSRVVPIYRSAFRIGLWIATFLLAAFAAVGLGLTLGGKMPGNLGGSIAAATVLFVILAGLLHVVRIEIRAQRSIHAQQANTAGEEATMPASISPRRVVILSTSLGVVIVALTLLAWLGP